MDLDLEEWCLIRNKMLRYHFNISEEIKAVVQSIRAEMRPELIPLAEEKANYEKMRINHKMAQNENPIQLRFMRKTIARLNTELAKKLTESK